MRLPRVRFTVRRIMAVVAIVGVGFGVFHWVEWRAATFRQLAIHYRKDCDWFYVLRGLAEPQSGTIGRRFAHQKAMAEKYAWAARYPWLPVEPDPPEPD